MMKSTPYTPIVLTSGDKRFVIFVRRCNNIKLEVEFRSFSVHNGFLGKGRTIEESVRNLLFHLTYQKELDLDAIV